MLCYQLRSIHYTAAQIKNCKHNSHYEKYGLSSVPKRSQRGKSNRRGTRVTYYKTKTILAYEVGLPCKSSMVRKFNAHICWDKMK